MSSLALATGMVAAPGFISTTTTLKSNNGTFIRFSGRSNNINNYGGVGVHAMSRNDNVGAPLSGCLFVPSQLSVSEVSEGRKISEPESEEEEEYCGDWKQYLSESSITTKLGLCHLSLPLSKILLLPFTEYMNLNEEGWDFMNEPFDEEKCLHEPFYDGPIVLVDNNDRGIRAPTRYFSLKDQNVLEIETCYVPKYAISSLGHWLVEVSEALSSRMALLNLRKMSFHYPIPDPENIACHPSSPLLDDIENKDRLVLHRFASSSFYFYCHAKPWDCVIMAIDKSSGYLVYSSFLDYCWIVLDSMRNYTSGDLIYFNKDGNFYVLPNAQCGDIEVWRFQYCICSKITEINATFMDDDEHRNNSYHHIHSYLVESVNSNLLLVRRYVAAMVIQEDCNGDSSCNNNFFKTDNFAVFKLNFESKQWEVVSRLGDEALFVGSNSSFSLSSTKYPEVNPNCIYFTDQLCHHGGDKLHGKDSGIFHLQDCTFTSLFSPELNLTQAPLWLRPDERPWRQWNQHHDDDDDDDDDDEEEEEEEEEGGDSKS